MDIVETYRELAGGLIELYLTSAAGRTNEVMRVLTVIATIFLPLTFVTGLYGMNFDRSAGPLNMPELGLRYGYPLVIAVMIAAALGMFVWFRRRGWL
jgi:magnesium transporter